MDHFQNFLNNEDFQPYMHQQAIEKCERTTKLTNLMVDVVEQYGPPDSYSSLVPMHTSELRGMNWVNELIHDHRERMHNSFRMYPSVFLMLCKVLNENYGLKDGQKITHVECVAIFLYVCAQGSGYRQACERFQRSPATISKCFHRVIDVIDAFAPDKIYSDFAAGVHPHINESPMYFHYFKDCVRALDGTHVPTNMQISFIGRSVTTTQNVLGVCDFDMCFTYCSATWEGSMHGGRILGAVLNIPCLNFHVPPPGKYYLVDSAYPNMQGFLVPYKGERYHPNTFRDGHHLNNANELFNRAHASLRSVSEQKFGVWKKRWHILDKMDHKDITLQGRIVASTMALHNFIRRTDPEDPGFTISLPGSSQTTEEDTVPSTQQPTKMSADPYMNVLTDSIRNTLCGTD